MAAILEAKQVGFAYGAGKWAIHELSFVITTPRRICLLGANGVGKSTLMMLLNGTLRPLEGGLLVLGKPVDYSRAGLQRLRQQVGIVLQDPDDQLFGATVEQDVAFGPLNNGFSSAEARAKVVTTLESLGITHLVDRPIHQLSLGEKKRVALAGVLVLEPEIILLDEPSAGLDHIGTTAVLKLLSRLHSSGTTVVISTHDTDLAYAWGEDAWILMKGGIARQGPIVDVLQELEVLDRAHLRVPWLVEAGFAVREAYPHVASRPLPKDRNTLTSLIYETRSSLPA